jgi:predicted TIM-barrel fold metal-dependent hydrolase
MKHFIIDSHTHVIPHREPVWGWGPRFTVEQLLEAMDCDYEVMGEIQHVSKALVMTGLGLTSVGNRSLLEAQQYVLDGIQRHKDRLYLNVVINPRTWVPDQLDQVRDWIEPYNLRMLKLHPTMHNYWLPLYNPYPADKSKKMIYPVFELARELGVPVMIHMGESPSAIPATISPIAGTFSDVPIVVAHSGANNEPCLAVDAILLARMHENVYLGNSWVQPQDLMQMYYALGASKIIYESDCSPMSMGQGMRTVINLHLPPPLGVSASKDEVYQMLGGNIASLCKIPLE